MPPGDDAVRAQYERYPYPARDPEDERRRLVEGWHDRLEMINHYCFRGRCRFESGFRVLVAGGGTGDSTIFLAEQLRGRGARVVHLEPSAASLAIARRRAEIRGLEDIEWVQGSLLEADARSLGRFDYVNCSGVLHHLPDPDAGLRALRGLLDEGGAMMLMVYAGVGRTAVYQLQALLRSVNRGVDDPAARLDAVRALLAGLPQGNWFRHCREWFDEAVTGDDAGLVDLLLHAQDRAYTVPELYAWVEGAGLTLASLMYRGGRAAYFPETWLTDPLLLERLARLPLRERQAAAELAAGTIVKHFCYCAPAAGTVADPADPDNVPYFFPEPVQGLVDMLYEHPGAPVRLTTRHGAPAKIVPRRHTLRTLEYVDGRRTLGEIAALVAEDAKREAPGTVAAQVIEDFLPVYETLNAVDMMLLRHRDVPAFASPAALQARMARA